MSGGLIVQSGSPWNVTVGFDQSGNVVAGSERPNLVMPADQIMTGNINQWVNPAGFTSAGAGHARQSATRLFGRSRHGRPGLRGDEGDAHQGTGPPSVPRRVLQSAQPPQLRAAECERVRADAERRRRPQPDVWQDHGDHHVVAADSVCLEASVLAPNAGFRLGRFRTAAQRQRQPVSRRCARQPRNYFPLLRHNGAPLDVLMRRVGNVSSHRLQ